MTRTVPLKVPVRKTAHLYIYPGMNGPWKGPPIYCSKCAALVNPKKDPHCVAHYSTDFTPCGCATHAFIGVPCTSVERENYVGKRGTANTKAWCRCMNCGEEWREARTPLRNRDGVLVREAARTR